MESIFVFVVCGAREHIDTLHFSLKALQKFSTKKILVVTDSTRNEIPVLHSEILNISTPQNFNHHQASIFLKTGLHKFLPNGNLYCYLDTDVVALSENVNSIFQHYNSPITFCTDHCTINEFSPSAIYCGCMEAFKTDAPKPYFYYEDFQKNVLPKLLYIDASIAEIETEVAASKKSKWIYKWHQFKFNLPGTFYHLNKKFKMNKATGEWYDQNNLHLKYAENAKDDILYISEKTGFRYDLETKEWFRKNGTSLTKLSCNHLIEKISECFGVIVKPASWQHWNGGVFLFDDASHNFLEFWHQATIDIFKDTNWRTRDQGTLAATVWKFEFMQHSTLPVSFNLIADYNNETIEYSGNLSFKISTKKKKIYPDFIHVYHHWGDMSWAVWKDVKNHILGNNENGK